MEQDPMLLHYTLTPYEDTLIGQIVEIDGLIVEGKNEKEVIEQFKIGVAGYFKTFPNEIHKIKQVKAFNFPVAA